MSNSKSKHYEKLQSQYPDFIEAVEQLGRTVKTAGPLSEKSVLLIQLAAAAAMRSEGSVVSHAKRAMSAGASKEEVAHALVALTSTIGFPTVAAALSWIEKTDK